jgi:hypothetical protein
MRAALFRDTEGLGRFASQPPVPQQLALIFDQCDTKGTGEVSREQLLQAKPPPRALGVL